MNTSQFILQVSLDAAQSILTDQTVFTLTPEQWDAFQHRLDEPPRVIPALQKLHVDDVVLDGGPDKAGRCLRRHLQVA